MELTISLPFKTWVAAPHEEFSGAHEVPARLDKTP